METQIIGTLGHSLIIYGSFLILLSFLDNNTLYNWFADIFLSLYLHTVWFWLIRGSMFIENIILVLIFAQFKKISKNTSNIKPEGYYSLFLIGLFVSFICFASVLSSYFLAIFEYNGFITIEQYENINLIFGLGYFVSFIGCTAFFMLSWSKFTTMIKKINEKQMNNRDIPNVNIKPLIRGVWIIVIGYGFRILTLLTDTSIPYELYQWHFVIKMVGLAFLALGCIHTGKIMIQMFPKDISQDFDDSKLFLGLSKTIVALVFSILAIRSWFLDIFEFPEWVMVLFFAVLGIIFGVIGLFKEKSNFSAIGAILLGAFMVYWWITLIHEFL